MAGAPCPLPHALHANLLVMDELGGAVLRRSDGLHQREELCLDARTGRCDHHLLGGPQRQSSALRVEGQGRRYPAQNRRRQTRARRWPCPMQLYFRYITLVIATPSMWPHSGCLRASAINSEISSASVLFSLTVIVLPPKD